MGQTLSRKPISQQRSFATLNTASNPFAPQPQQQPVPMTAGIDMIGQASVPMSGGDQAPMAGGFQVPSVLSGFRNQGLAGFRVRNL